MRYMKALRRIFLACILMSLVAGMAQGQNIASVTGEKDPFKVAQVYPNPATEFITVRFESPQARIAKFSVYSIIGTTQETEVEVVDDLEARIRVKDLASGYYFLAIRDEDSQIRNSIKFLKR